MRASYALMFNKRRENKNVFVRFIFYLDYTKKTELIILDHYRYKYEVKNVRL
jgi:hypothetical protein